MERPADLPPVLPNSATIAVPSEETAGLSLVPWFCKEFGECVFACRDEAERLLDHLRSLRLIPPEYEVIDSRLTFAGNVYWASSPA